MKAIILLCIVGAMGRHIERDDSESSEEKTTVMTTMVPEMTTMPGDTSSASVTQLSVSTTDFPGSGLLDKADALSLPDATTVLLNDSYTVVPFGRTKCTKSDSSSEEKTTMAPVVPTMVPAMTTTPSSNDVTTQSGGSTTGMPGTGPLAKADALSLPDATTVLLNDSYTVVPFGRTKATKSDSSSEENTTMAPAKTSTATV